MKAHLHVIIGVLCLLFYSSNLLGQAKYTGIIGSDSVEMDLYTNKNFYKDSGAVFAIFLNKRTNDPVYLHGTFPLHGDLTLWKGKNKDNSPFVLVIPGFDDDSITLLGSCRFKNIQSKKIVCLKRIFVFSNCTDSTQLTEALIQTPTTKDHYFKAGLLRVGDDYFEVSAILVYSKKTGRLLQVLPTGNGALGWYKSIKIKDFTFDGYLNFMIDGAYGYTSKSRHDGYFLFQPESNKFKKFDMDICFPVINKKNKLLISKCLCESWEPCVIRKIVFKGVGGNLIVQSKVCLERTEYGYGKYIRCPKEE